MDITRSADAPPFSLPLPLRRRRAGLSEVARFVVASVETGFLELRVAGLVDQVAADFIGGFGVENL